MSTVRDAEHSITLIHAHWVHHELASFELDPPDAAETTRRFAAVCEAGHPCPVADNRRGAILGDACAGPYRAAGRRIVYVAPDSPRRGTGRVLLTALLGRLEAGPWRQVVAVIGGSGNAASIRMHRACGFQPASLLPAVGWKHGRWVDSVLMNRSPGTGASALP